MRFPSRSRQSTPRALPPSNTRGPRNTAMVSQADNSWQDISNLTRRMLTSARAGDWVGVATLEAERQQRLSALADTRGAALGSQALKHYQQLLEDDRELLRLAAAARGDLGQQLAELSQGRRALAAYGRAGKSTYGT